MGNEFIFVVKPSNSSKAGDIVFYDPDGLKRFVRDVGPGVVNYRIGFINPYDQELYIHKIDVDTLKALI